jgi:hypothetical protein
MRSTLKNSIRELIETAESIIVIISSEFPGSPVLRKILMAYYVIRTLFNPVIAV